MEKELDTFGKAPHYQQYLLEKASSFSYSPFIRILRDCGKPISLSAHFCDHISISFQRIILVVSFTISLNNKALDGFIIRTALHETNFTKVLETVHCGSSPELCPWNPELCPWNPELCLWRILCCVSSLCHGGGSGKKKREKVHGLLLSLLGFCSCQMILNPLKRK